MTSVAVDNDFLLKGASYGLLIEMIGAISSEIEHVSILGAAKFVVLKRLEKNGNCFAPLESKSHFLKFLETACVLEPTQEEILFAAELESQAQRAGMGMDEGESQLIAIVICRNFTNLATGDKRAIAALGFLRELSSDLQHIDGKVICLEQVFYRLLSVMDPDVIKAAICNEPNADKAISICFSCNTSSVEPSHWQEGLYSYISNIRSKAARILVE